MPAEIDNCVESVLEENPDYEESRAYAICWAQKNKGNLGLDDNADHTAMLQAVERHFDDPCWEDYTMVGMKPDPNGSGMVPNCVPDDEVPDANLEKGCPEGMTEVAGFCVESFDDAPPSVVQASRIMAGGSLESEPIKREELSGDKVAYRNIKLLDAGVWTDQSSQTPTLYDEQTFANLEAVSPNGHKGPPVNISHDIDAEGEPNQASVGGYIDPDSLETDGEALFGDIILDTGESAGDFADENLKSALESDGEVGFSPSVEIDPSGYLEAVDHPKAREHATGGELSGLGLVRDPASKTVDFAHETRNRAVALSDSQTDKDVYIKMDNMERELMEPDEVRETLDKVDMPGLDEMTDDEVLDVAEMLHDELMEQMDMDMGHYGDDEKEEEEESEMADYGGEGEEEEEEEGMEMEGDMEMVMEQVDDLRQRLEEIEDMMEQMSEMSVEKSELEATKSELADEELVSELEKRLENLEEKPETKTLAGGSKSSEDKWAWAESDGHVSDSSNSL